MSPEESDLSIRDLGASARRMSAERAATRDLSVEALEAGVVAVRVRGAGAGGIPGPRRRVRGGRASGGGGRRTAPAAVLMVVSAVGFLVLVIGGYWP